MTEPARAQRAIVKPVRGGDSDEGRRSSAADTTMPVPAVADSAPAQAANGWGPMDTVPIDGKPVWLADGKGNVCEAVWRPSRAFSMEKNAYGKWIGKWTPSGFWSMLGFGGAKVPFKPTAWHAK